MNFTWLIHFFSDNMEKKILPPATSTQVYWVLGAKTEINQFAALNSVKLKIGLLFCTKSIKFWWFWVSFVVRNHQNPHADKSPPNSQNKLPRGICENWLNFNGICRRNRVQRKQTSLRHHHFQKNIIFLKSSKKMVVF